MATDDLRVIWRRVSALLDDLRNLKRLPEGTDWGVREQHLMEALALLEQRIAEAARELPPDEREK